MYEGVEYNIRTRQTWLKQATSSGAQVLAKQGYELTGMSAGSIGQAQAAPNLYADRLTIVWHMSTADTAEERVVSQRMTVVQWCSRVLGGVVGIKSGFAVIVVLMDSVLRKMRKKRRSVAKAPAAHVQKCTRVQREAMGSGKGDVSDHKSVAAAVVHMEWLTHMKSSDMRWKANPLMRGGTPDVRTAKGQVRVEACPGE